MQSASFVKTAKVPTVITKASLIALALASALGVLSLFAAPKAQALSTIVWNQSSSTWVPLRYAPEGTQLNTKSWVREGKKFRMICWIDHQWWTGNYRSNRWFYGIEQQGGLAGYIHSSYVYYQTSVPRC